MLGHWNYRVYKQASSKFERACGIDWYYTIRETYYNDDGTIRGFSSEPRGVCGDSISDIAEVLDWMRNCLDKQVLELDSENCIKNNRLLGK